MGTWAGLCTWCEEPTTVYISELLFSPESGMGFAKLVISA